MGYDYSNTGIGGMIQECYNAAHIAAKSSNKNLDLSLEILKTVDKIAEKLTIMEQRITELENQQKRKPPMVRIR